MNEPKTPNLGLNKIDRSSPSTTYFDLDKYLDQNWEKVDEGVATRKELVEIREALGEIDIPDASLTDKGIVQLSNAMNDESIDKAATPNAVKRAYDRANAAFTSASDGKVKVRNAITGAKGIVEDADGDGIPTFDELVTGISTIKKQIDNYYGDSTTDMLLTGTITSTLNGGPVIIKGKNIDVLQGTVVTVTNPCQGLVIYAEGDVNINGTINMSKKGGLLTSDIMPLAPIIPIAGGRLITDLITSVLGGKGGNGGRGGGAYLYPSSMYSNYGIGGQGSQRRMLGGIGGGGGGGGGGRPEATTPRGGNGGNGDYGGGGNVPRFTAAISESMIGNRDSWGGGGGGGSATRLQKYTNAYVGGTGQANGGGSGGSGGSYYYTSSVDTINSEYSGGAVLIIAKGKITIGSTGEILADGGNGSNGGAAAIGNGGESGGGGGGGGAGGGVISLIYGTEYLNNGKLSVNGGLGGAGGLGSDDKTAITINAGLPGSSGQVGTISVVKMEG